MENSKELPIGFSFSLAMNENAMKFYSNLDKYSKEDEAEMLKIACEAMSNGLDVIDVVKLAYLSGKYGNTETGKINTLIYLMQPSQIALDKVYAKSKKESRSHFPNVVQRIQTL